MIHLWTFVANGARLVMEFAERQRDQHDRHVIDMLRELWVRK